MKKLMKKYLILIATAIILLSCKKENAGTIANNNPALSKSETLYPIEFNYSLFEVTGNKRSNTATNSLSTSALKDQIKYLRYFVISGPADNPIDELRPIKQKTQKSTDPNFGIITDSLPTGQYVFCFVGAQAPGHVITERKFGSDRWGYPIFYYNDSKIYDTFTKRIDLTITDKVNQSVVLSRATIKVTFKFTDIMPANAATVKVRITDFPVGLDLFHNIGNPKPHWDLGIIYPTATFSYPVNDSDKGKTGFTSSTFAWAFYYPTIDIDCFALNGELLAHREFERQAFFSANTNYVYTGKMFDEKSHFTITVNDKWDEPVKTPFSLPSAITTN
jgi:hypothetical protein